MSKKSKIEKWQRKVEQKSGKENWQRKVKQKSDNKAVKEE